MTDGKECFGMKGNEKRLDQVAEIRSGYKADTNHQHNAVVKSSVQ